MPRYDIEEIAPGRFIVRDARANNILKGEGQLEGQRFTLTSQRRAGLLARLRERGFRVHSLEDRIAALPSLPGAYPLGPAGFHPLGSPHERLSAFDPDTLGWHALEPEPHHGTSGWWLRPGWSVRRRKGRGEADYYLARSQGSGVGLRGVSEDAALLAGYALAAADGEIPLTAQVAGDEAALPDVALPPSYRRVLNLLGREERGILLVDERAWPFAQDLFARLGVDLRAA
jgi:hypothetical protein